MKIGGFLTLKNPIKRQDLYIECISCMVNFLDEILIVDAFSNDGSIKKIKELFGNKVKIIQNKWQEEFDWKHIGKTFTLGYKNCKSDFIIRFDCDYIIHEDDFEDIRSFLKDCDAPVVCMVKRQFLKYNSYAVKALVPIAFNKKKYGNRIKLDSGGDLCQPSLDGKEINKDEMPIIARKEYHIIDDSADPKLVSRRLEKVKTDNIGLYSYNDFISIWNYECLKRTKNVQAKEFYRFARAWGRTFGKNLFGIQSQSDSIREFLRMQTGRYFIFRSI